MNKIVTKTIRFIFVMYLRVVLIPGILYTIVFGM